MTNITVRAAAEGMSDSMEKTMEALRLFSRLSIEDQRRALVEIRRLQAEQNAEKESEVAA